MKNKLENEIKFLTEKIKKINEQNMNQFLKISDQKNYFLMEKYENLVDFTKDKIGLIFGNFEQKLLIKNKQKIIKNKTQNLIFDFQGKIALNLCKNLKENLIHSENYSKKLENLLLSENKKYFDLYDKYYNFQKKAFSNENFLKEIEKKFLLLLKKLDNQYEELLIYKELKGLENLNLEDLNNLEKHFQNSINLTKNEIYKQTYQQKIKQLENELKKIQGFSKEKSMKNLKNINFPSEEKIFNLNFNNSFIQNEDSFEIKKFSGKIDELIDKKKQNLRKEFEENFNELKEEKVFHMNSIENIEKNIIKSNLEFLEEFTKEKEQFNANLRNKKNEIISKKKKKSK